MQAQRPSKHKTMALLQRCAQWELMTCRWLNHLGHQPRIKQFFTVISRLGDGAFWYIAMALLPVFQGITGIKAVLHIATTGLVCVALYSQLKSRLTRQRPYESNGDITAHTAPLDRYSFPSGHTMNGVNFAILLIAFAPQFSVIIIPFTLLLALSRVVLGLHFPTDVVIGAVLGYAIANLSLVLWPEGLFIGVNY